MIFKRFFLVCAVAAVLFLSSCGAQEAVTTFAPLPDETATPNPTPDPTASAEPTVAPYDGQYNALNGLPISDELAGKRAFAITLNNIREAQPIHGIIGADLIYELPAEGGVTRIIAVYSDTSAIPSYATAIGSIRSARDYFLDIALGLDAIYIHAGGSPQSYSDIKSLNVDHFDGVAVSYPFIYRDSSRKSQGYAYEHTMFINGEALMSYAAENVKRTERKTDLPYIFADDAVPDGDDASGVSVKFSDYKTTQFTYDAESKLYKISQFKGEFADGGVGDPLTAVNILILKVSAATVPGDEAGRLSVNLVGSGNGYYVSGGKYTEIKWSKSSRSAPFEYALAESDEPLTLSRGVSYINIVPGSAKIEFSASDVSVGN
ncbi:MAG: DUF3048 domain-containing protein [Oscillospiraceae bacterium]|nr:DUF3048 domain-containing protein [Oscillospiraceae bacterium]